MERETILNDSMTAPEATEAAPGLLVRKISLQSLSMLSRINSPFADISAAAKGEAKFRLHELAEFVFIHAAPPDDVLRAYYNGGHLGLSRAADAFAAKIPQEALPRIIAAITGDARAIEASKAAAIPDASLPASKNAPSPAA